MAATWTEGDAVRALRWPTASDDKYSRGVVGFRTGSEEYPGAAVLGVAAAWRTGVGMVRYLGPRRPADLVLARRPETVVAPGRVHAWVVGSGTETASRTDADTEVLRGILSGDVPVVVDAGALDLALGAHAPRIVTPHDREHERLRDALGLGAVGDREAAAVETARALDAVVLLKGALTIVAAPGGPVVRVDSGSPWLATAGTGDVLAGVLGALVASAAANGSAPDLLPLAASAAWLHGRAATLAAASASVARRGGPITALDVADALPRAVAAALESAR